jgi:hypothetical protein
MLRSTPPGEDATRGARARGVPALVDAQPPGEDHVTGEGPARMPADETPTTREVRRTLTNAGHSIDYLQLVSEAEDQALLYTNQAQPL